MVDSIASNYCLVFPVDYVAATLISLRNMLSSFRGGNRKLLSLLESKMQVILGLGAPARNLGYDKEGQVVTAETADEERRDGGVAHLPGAELLMALSMGNSSDDGTAFPWTDPDLMALLDVPVRLPDARPEAVVLEAAGDLTNSDRWLINDEPPGEITLGP